MRKLLYRKPSCKILNRFLILIIILFFTIPSSAQNKNPSKSIENQLQQIENELNKKTTESYIQSRLRLEKMISSNQINSDVYAHLSEIYCHLYYKNLNFNNEKNLLEKAESYAVKAYNLDKKNPLAFRALGNVLMIKGNYEKARTFFNYIQVKLKSNSPDTYYYMAISRQEDITDESTASYADLQKALTSSYSHIWSLQDLIIAYLKKENIEKAEFYYKKLTENFPDHPENDYYCGMMQLHKNNLKEAKKCFKAFIEKNTYSNLSAILSNTKWNKD